MATFKVSWTNLLSAGLELHPDSEYQELLKSVYFWPSSSKIKRMSVLMNHGT